MIESTQAAGVPSPHVLLLLRSPFGLPGQQQQERYPWPRFHLIPGRKLSSAWGQAKGSFTRRPRRLSRRLSAAWSMACSGPASTRGPGFLGTCSYSSTMRSISVAQLSTSAQRLSRRRPPDRDRRLLHQGDQDGRARPPRGASMSRTPKASRTGTICHRHSRHDPPSAAAPNWSSSPPATVT